MTKELTTTNDELVAVIKELVKIFRLERILYISTILISLIVLFACAVTLLIKDFSSNVGEVIGLCGSTGVISYTCGRFLHMWSDTITVVTKHFKSKEL